MQAEESQPPISLHDASSSVDQDALIGLDAAQAEPSSGVHRTEPSIHQTNTILKQRPTEKRKRSRVTPEQLIELEREFALNRTPTGAQRKAISERLDMQERQTQIWFQNRRAKAKHQDQRPSSPDRNRSAGAHLESYIAQLIREKEPVTLIPCSDLKIGHWTRINPSTLHHEVLAYTSQSRQCISWFIRSSGLSFKIEVPFSIIKNAQLKDVTAPQLITLVLELNSIPLFFVQQPDVRMRPGETINDVRKRIGIAPHLPLPNIGANPGEWVASNDWTQNQQASRVLRHELTGPRTSIIPGVQTFPQEFGLLQADTSPPSGTEATGDNMPFGDPGLWWDNLHTLDVAHTPNSSVSGYESSISWSTGSSVSISSYAGSVNTPASSTRATPAPTFEFNDMNLGQDGPSTIAQSVPPRASPLPPQFNADAQGGHSHHNSLSLGDLHSLGDLGFNPLTLTDVSNQGLLSQQGASSTHNFGLGQNFTFPPAQQQGQGAEQALYTATGSIPTNNAELLSTSNINLSHYGQQRQHERNLSGGLMAQQGASQTQASMFDFGLGQGLDPYTTQDFTQSTSGTGTVNLGFEVDATLGTTLGSHINTYPQLSQSQFDDSALYLQQPDAGQAFTGLSGFPSDGLSGATIFDVNQFVSNPQAQAQLHPQTQGQGPSLGPGSQPNSRRNSTYGFQ